MEDATLLAVYSVVVRRGKLQIGGRLVGQHTTPVTLVHAGKYHYASVGVLTAEVTSRDVLARARVAVGDTTEADVRIRGGLAVVACKTKPLARDVQQVLLSDNRFYPVMASPTAVGVLAVDHNVRVGDLVQPDWSQYPQSGTGHRSTFQSTDGDVHLVRSPRANLEEARVTCVYVTEDVVEVLDPSGVHDEEVYELDHEGPSIPEQVTALLHKPTFDADYVVSFGSAQVIDWTPVGTVVIRIEEHAYDHGYGNTPDPADLCQLTREPPRSTAPLPASPELVPARQLREVAKCWNVCQGDRESMRSFYASDPPRNRSTNVASAGYLLRARLGYESYKRGRPLPSGDTSVDVPGGIVVPPARLGLVEHVVLLDFKSFYAYCAIAGECSPDTAPSAPAQLQEGDAILPQVLQDFMRERQKAQAAGLPWRAQLFKREACCIIGILGQRGSIGSHRETLRRITTIGRALFETLRDGVARKLECGDIVVDAAVAAGTTDGVDVSLTAARPLTEEEVDGCAMRLRDEVAVLVAATCEELGLGGAPVLAVQGVGSKIYGGGSKTASRIRPLGSDNPYEVKVQGMPTKESEFAWTMWFIEASHKLRHITDEGASQAYRAMMATSNIPDWRLRSHGNQYHAMYGGHEEDTIGTASDRTGSTALAVVKYATRAIEWIDTALKPTPPARKRPVQDGTMAPFLVVRRPSKKVAVE